MFRRKMHRACGYSAQPSGINGNLLHILDNPSEFGEVGSDYFGQMVSSSQTYTIVGAPNEYSLDGQYSGVAYIFDNVTGNLLHTLYNPNAYDTGQHDYFGTSVAITESYAIVGAYGEKDAQGSFYSGVAYIFNPVTGQLLHTLDNPNPDNSTYGDAFGQDVDICESYSIVGAYSESQAGPDSGKAYIFDNATGNLLHTLDNPNAYGTTQSDWFGLAVAITESYAIAGAYREDDAGGGDSGKAYIFSTTTGQLLHTLNNPNAYGTSVGDRFGYSVSITESYAIVGAYGEDDAGGGNSGKAYIFSTTTGQLLHTLDNPNATGPSTGDEFGTSVDITESLAIVGAYGEHNVGHGTSDSGKAYIFSATTGQLLHTLINPNAYVGEADWDEYDYFGWSVSIFGSYVSVGAYLEHQLGGYNSGAAYIFDSTTGNLLHTLNNPNAYGANQYDAFGFKVAMSNSYSIIAPENEEEPNGTGTYSYSGVAYIYDNATGQLLHTLTNPNPYGTPEGDNFGISDVDICESYAIVGAADEDESANQYDDSGKAYIYSTTTGQLIHTLDNPNAYGTITTDRFGGAVGISESYAIVGASLEDEAGNGFNSGKAYIFSTATGQLLHTLNNPNIYDDPATDFFGNTVDICESYAVVSANNDKISGLMYAGLVHVYNPSTGQLLYTLNSPAPVQSGNFGGSIAVSESYLIVGASGESYYSGRAYIYNPATGQLLHTLENPNPYGTTDFDYFGASVDICESYAIVGASGEDSVDSSYDGKAYIFDPSTGQLLYTLDNPNVFTGPSFNDDSFGVSVAISSSYVLASAPYEHSIDGQNTGKAYIFN